MREYRMIKFKLNPTEQCKKEINRVLIETAIIYNQMLELKIDYYIKTATIKDFSYLSVAGEKAIKTLDPQILIQIQYDSEDEFMDALIEFRHRQNLLLRMLNGYGKVIIPCCRENEGLDLINNCLNLPTIGRVKYQHNNLLNTPFKIGKVEITHERDDCYYAAFLVKSKLFKLGEPTNSNGYLQALSIEYAETNVYMDNKMDYQYMHIPSYNTLEMNHYL